MKTHLVANALVSGWKAASQTTDEDRPNQQQHLEVSHLLDFRSFLQRVSDNFHPGSAAGRDAEAPSAFTGGSDSG